MNLEQLTIGQMARLNHISEQTLRLYDKMDLLIPQGVNPENGYRYYSIGQSAQLDLIRYYQRIGFSLKDIQSNLMSQSMDLINHQLLLRKSALEKEIEELKRCRESITGAISNYNYYASLPKKGNVFIEYLPSSNIIVYDTGENMYDYDYNHYEYNLRRFKNYLEDIHFEAPLFGNVGTIVRRNNLSDSHLTSTELFITTEESHNNYPKTELIPKGAYLSLCCTDFENEEAYANMLLHQAQSAEMNITGDYYCEVLTEYPEIHSNKRRIDYKIRVRIS